MIMDQLAMANSVHRYGQVLRRQVVSLHRSSKLHAEGIRGGGVKKNMEEEVWLDEGICALPVKFGCWHSSDFHSVVGEAIGFKTLIVK